MFEEVGRSSAALAEASFHARMHQGSTASGYPRLKNARDDSALRIFTSHRKAETLYRFAICCHHLLKASRPRQRVCIHGKHLYIPSRFDLSIILRALGKLTNSTRWFSSLMCVLVAQR